jgi:hypothetical protein
MTIEVKQASLVLIQSTTFRQGMNDGATWYFHGDPQRPVTEEAIIDFLQGNAIELAQEGYLDEDRLGATTVF